MGITAGTAAVIGGALAAGGSVASGMMGAGAAEDAASAQERSAGAALGLQRDQYNDATLRLAPFLAAGTNALPELQKLLGIGPGGTGATNPILQMLGFGTGGGGIDPTKFQGSPGFQWMKQQGLDAVRAGAAGRGGMSGNTLQALQKAGTGLAQQDWYNYLGALQGGYNSLLGALGGLVGGGQNAAVTQGGFNQNMANAGGNLLTQAGNAQAGGIMGGANAIGGGITGATNNLMSGLMFNKLLAQQQQPGGGWPTVTNTYNPGYDYQAAWADPMLGQTLYPGR